MRYHYTIHNMRYHYTIKYHLSDGREAEFHTYANTPAQAIEHLYDSVPDIKSGRVAYKIPITRRVTL